MAVARPRGRDPSKGPRNEGRGQKADPAARMGVWHLGWGEGFVVAWYGYSGQDGSGYGVQGQRFRTHSRDIFTDGFESGNTQAWSATVPSD